MNRRRITLAIPLAIVILSLAGSGAAHAGVVLGASFGYTHISYPDVSGVANDAIGVPGVVLSGQPGLRVGYLAPGGRWDLNADVGVGYNKFNPSSGPSATEASFELLPQAQVNLPVSGGVVPFVNAGVGIEYETTYIGETVSGTRPAYGAGIGVRKSVSDSHGILRIEFRFDHLPKVEKTLTPFSTFTFLARDMLSLKLGFDLVLAR
jgi:hypothetical protein